MWLLDVNMPRQLKGLLAELGIPAETANEQRYRLIPKGLRNSSSKRSPGVMGFSFRIMALLHRGYFTSLLPILSLAGS